MIQRVTRLTVGLTLVLQTGAALAEDGPCLPNPDRPGPPELCIESVELDTTRLTPDGNGYLDRAGVHVALLVRGSQPHHARGGDYKLVVALTAAGPDGVLFDADLVEEAIERGAGPPGAHLRRINLEFSPLAGPTRAPLGDYTLTVHADLLRSEQRRDRLVDSDAANAGVVTLLDFPAETDLLLERAAIDDLIGRRSPAPFTDIGEQGASLRIYEADPSLRARAAEILQELPMPNSTSKAVAERTWGS